MSIGDWDKIIDEAEAERFVGREQELDIFRKQINSAPPRYLIFYITGQGGSGKSALLNRYRDIARDNGFLLADSSEQERDVPSMLGRFAQQLAKQDYPLKHFDDRYKTYRQKMNEIENDPKAPQGLATMLGRTAVRTGFIVGDLVPGVRRGLDYLPQELIETKTSEWVDYLTKKFSNKEDLALVRDPVPILTSLFFKDLNEIAQRCKVLLCFENFEATRQELHDWLLRLRDYKPSQNIRIAIAGRDRPGAKWDLRSVTLNIHLDVFTEQEAETFLDVYGITDAKRRAEILKFTGRLPVLMSWLAAPETKEPDLSPTSDIVERFLRWVNEPILRQVALWAAIPRTFNFDILKLLLDNHGQAETVSEQVAFDWLKTMPFVQQRSDGWQYHDVVRRMMLDYQRHSYPGAYAQTHAALANFYDSYRRELSFSDEERWKNEQWRKYTLAYIYHLLIADHNKHWREAISLFTVAVRKRRDFAVEIIELLTLDEISEILSPEQQSTVGLFRQQLQTILQKNLQDGFVMFDKLCKMEGLSPQAKGYALAFRGECHQLDDKWDKALLDFEEALHYIPEDTWIIASQGWTYSLMGRYTEALTDLDRAIALDGELVWAIASRGFTYSNMGNYHAALTDLDRAIQLDPQDASAFAYRGVTYRMMGHYLEALADLDRAIALDDKYAWAIARRGWTYHLMERYQEALADYNRTIALNEKHEWAIYCRAQVLLLTGQTSAFERDLKAIIELTRSTIRKSPDNQRACFHLALYTLLGGNLAEAEAQYAQLIPTCSSLPDLDDAVVDLREFLAVQPSHELAQRILTQVQERLAELKH